MARKFTLENFVKKHGVRIAAQKLVTSEQSIHKAIRAGREVTVYIEKDGSIRAREEKDFPNWSKVSRDAAQSPG